MSNFFVVVINFPPKTSQRMTGTAYRNLKEAGGSVQFSATFPISTVYMVTAIDAGLLGRPSVGFLSHSNVLR